MSKETVNQRHTLSILFLLCSILLVAAMWNLPESKGDALETQQRSRN
jgi:hypothetical protein